MLTQWEMLPDSMRNDAVRKYYDILTHKRGAMFAKRLLDIFLSALLLVLLSPVFIATAVAIKLDSKGPVFYRQTRVTTAGKEFKIFKFRSMCVAADKGLHLTTGNDSRITRVGRFIRKYKIDELPQFINVLKGEMSFVGTRPEVSEYVAKYTPEMMATLLMPAGITSKASISYKDESALLSEAEDSEKMYLDVILPQKMKYNLSEIENFSLMNDVRIIGETVFAIFK